MNRRAVPGGAAVYGRIERFFEELLDSSRPSRGQFHQRRLLLEEHLQKTRVTRRWRIWPPLRSLKSEVVSRQRKFRVGGFYKIRVVDQFAQVTLPLIR
jgi:hypothetical protein